MTGTNAIAATHQLMRRYFAAQRANDHEALSGMLVPNVVVHACHPDDLAGTLRGLNEFLAWRERKRSMAGPQYGFRLHDLAVGQRHAVAFFKIASSRDDQLYEWHQTALFHIKANRISEVWVHQELVREAESPQAATADRHDWFTAPFR